MEPVLDKARAGQNLLEKLMNAIPGFKGYREKELRRDADRLQREHMALRLEACKKPLDGISVAATRSGELGLINDVETARKRLDKLANRIRYADRGYAGFFAAVKVDEAALARLYQFDVALIDGVDAVQAAAEASATGPGAGVRAMIAAVDALDVRMGEREAMLDGIR